MIAHRGHSFLSSGRHFQIVLSTSTLLLSPDPQPSSDMERADTVPTCVGMEMTQKLSDEQERTNVIPRRLTTVAFSRWPLYSLHFIPSLSILLCISPLSSASYHFAQLQVMANPLSSIPFNLPSPRSSASRSIGSLSACSSFASLRSVSITPTGSSPRAWRSCKLLATNATPWLIWFPPTDSGSWGTMVDGRSHCPPFFADPTLLTSRLLVVAALLVAAKASCQVRAIRPRRPPVQRGGLSSRPVTTARNPSRCYSVDRLVMTMATTLMTHLSLEPRCIKALSFAKTPSSTAASRHVVIPEYIVPIKM